MRITVTTQPDPLLTHDDEIVRQSLGLDGTDRDELADSLLLSAQAELDGPKGRLGFSAAEQSVLVSYDSFEDPAIRLPGGPVAGSVYVTYTDADGASQELDDTTYFVSADGILSLVEGSSWPTVAGQANAISIAYDVGISDPADPRVQQMKQAIIAHAKMHMDMEDPETRRRVIEHLTSTLWTPVA
jgi:hypothetical protein